jgi:biopolymer transport protein ExbD
VVFQLLAFFMLTSTFYNTSVINVDLPSSKSGEVQVQNQVQEVVVTLFRNGDISIENDKILLSELSARVKDVYFQNENILVIIRGDIGVPYGELIEVMDIVRMTGVERISLVTVRE